jgi:DNA end-binding protein Ku
MEKTELAAVGKYVMRDRQHLGCLRVREGVITLEKMFFHDEIRPLDGIAPKGAKAKVAKPELEMATALIDQFTGSFEPEKYEDTYRETLVKIIKAKQKGKTIEAVEPEPEEEPADLLDALRASVEEAKGRGGARRGSVRAKRPTRKRSKQSAKSAKR